MTALLSVHNLHVGFGHDPHANEVVRGVSFELAAGETLAIVGESGSGKSVTALSINRLVDFGGGRITAGSITLQRGDGSTLDLTQAEEHTLRRIRGRDIGMIFQEPMTSLNPVHTIGRQIEEAFRLNRGLSGAAAHTAARAVLERVRIPEATSRLRY
jgi:peptide/nickel transport system ATP-binding protein/glutathione transport system ATP-binding protein